MIARRGVALAAALLAGALAGAPGGGALRAAEPAEPAGYRGEPYLAPTPATLAGARVVDAGEAAALWRAGAAFVDVLPRPERPAKLPAGVLWRDAPHPSIPGAIWLPNTGYAGLAAETLAYFTEGLVAATRGDKAAPLVIFCLRDCWMSLNAAKRALELGYAEVHWFPEGLDGWTFEALPVDLATPWSN